MTERVLLLDWDGVLNASWYQYDAEESPFERTAHLGIYSVDIPEIDVFDYQVLVARYVVDRLNAISKLPGVSAFWLTATGYFAPRLYAPLVGLKHFDSDPYATDVPGQQGAPGNGSSSTSWWKAKAAHTRLERTNADIMWVDDSIYGDLQKHFGFVKDRRRSFVKPDASWGLSAADLDAIEEWARNGTHVTRDTNRIAWEARNLQLAGLPARPSVRLPQSSPPDPRMVQACQTSTSTA